MIESLKSLGLTATAEDVAGGPAGTLPGWLGRHRPGRSRAASVPATEGGSESQSERRSSKQFRITGSITKLNGHFAHQEPMKMTENQPKWRITKRKSEIGNRCPRSPESSASTAWTTTAGGTSPSGSDRNASFGPAKRAKKLPRILTADDFRRFLSGRGSGRRRAALPDAAAPVLHGGSGQRTVPHRSGRRGPGKLQDLHRTRARAARTATSCSASRFATALRTHIAAHPNNRWLFQTRRNTKYSTRRVQQIVKLYAERAGVKATPHTFRHQAITWLTRHSRLGRRRTCNSSPAMPVGKPWPSTSTSPWTANWRGSTRRR